MTRRAACLGWSRGAGEQGREERCQAGPSWPLAVGGDVCRSLLLRTLGWRTWVDESECGCTHVCKQLAYYMNERLRQAAGSASAASFSFRLFSCCVVFGRSFALSPCLLPLQLPLVCTRYLRCARTTAYSSQNSPLLRPQACHGHSPRLGIPTL